MWYVEKLHSFDRDGAGVACSEPWVHCGVVFRQSQDILVQLRDSESSDVIRLLGKRDCWEQFDKALAEYNPYGYVMIGEGYCFLVEVDTLSIQFLAYVDSVSVYNSHSNVNVQLFTWASKVMFTPYDEYRTILNGRDSGSSATRSAFTLFQIMVFMHRGWFGDMFYFRGANGEIFEVSFTDVSKARAMIAKAITSGYNPIANRSRIRRDVCISQQ